MASLYLKYRPNTLDSVRGNEGTVESLKTILQRPKKNIPHALLFSGPSGCGKTTLARICAKALGVHAQDLIENDSAQYRGIDTIRDIRRSMVLSPMFGDVRVWILDEVHQLSKDAQSGLLKALEDTPSHVYFLLATTDPDKLLPALRNRCTQLTVQTLPDSEMKELLTDVVFAEKKKVPEDILDLIVDGSMGCVRSALVVLDKVIDLHPKKMEEAAQQQLAQENEAIEICRLLMNKAQWKEVTAFIQNTSQEPESLRRLILGYCTSIMLKKMNPQAYVVAACFTKPFYDTGKAGLVMSCWEALNG